MSKELPPGGFFDSLRSAWFYFIFALTLIFFEILQRLAIIFGRRAHEASVRWLNSELRHVLGTLKATVEVENFAELDPSTPYIIISNHQSLYDIPILADVFQKLRPRYIAKKELARGIPSVSFNLRVGGSAIIDRSNARQAIKEIERLGMLLNKETYSVIIFPEGTRARAGELKRFRAAGLASLLQMAPTAPLIPVTLDGSWKLAARWVKPAGIRVKVVVGAVIDRAAHDSLKDLMEEVHAIISQTLQRVRLEEETLNPS